MKKVMSRILTVVICLAIAVDSPVMSTRAEILNSEEDQITSVVQVLEDEQISLDTSKEQTLEEASDTKTFVEDDGTLDIDKVSVPLSDDEVWLQEIALENGDVSKIKAPRTEEGVSTWDCIWFGNYWQEDTNGDGYCYDDEGAAEKGKIADDKQPIKWRVIDYNSLTGESILLADKLIDIVQYNTKNEDTTWEKCTLRSYLNSYNSKKNAQAVDYSSKGFLTKAFTPSERAVIEESNLTNAKNPIWNTEGGNNTTDRIFCLSLAEVTNSKYGFIKNEFNRPDSGKKYHTEVDSTRIAVATKYTEDKPGYRTNEYGKDNKWWLRSPGSIRSNATGVGENGVVSADTDIYYNFYVDHYGTTVRPAFRMNLSTSSFLWRYAGTVSSDGTEDEIGGSEHPSEESGPDFLSVTMIQDGKKTNILTAQKSFYKDSEEKVTLTIVVDWKGNDPGRVFLTQGANKTIECPNFACVDLQPGKVFEPGKDIYAVALDKDGNLLNSRKLRLSVVEEVLTGEIDPIWDTKSFKLFDKVTFTVDGSKPVLSDQEFDIDAGRVSIDIEYDTSEGTFKGVLGFNFEKDKNGKFYKEEFKKYKEEIKEIEKKTERAKQIKQLYKKWGKGRVGHWKLQPEKKTEAAICGYIEGVLKNGNPVVTEGGLIGTAEFKYTNEGTVFIGVPIYYSLKAGGKVEVSVGVKDLIQIDNGRQPSFAGNLEIEPFFEIGGGIGVVYLGQVGARGKATLDINIALDRNYQKVDLNGQAYFEIKALTFKIYEREFAKGTWTIYETGRNAVSSSNNEGASLNPYNAIDINAKLKPEDRSYITRSTEWLGEGYRHESQLELNGADNAELSPDSSADSHKIMRVIQTNAYPDARMQFMRSNGKTVILWITDDTSRDAYNKSKLVYSIYDEVSDTWSSPASVMDDGKGDYYPDVADGYVVWQKAGRELLDDDTLKDAAKSMEIYIARFNGEDFDEPVCLTHNSVMDAQPHVAAKEGNVTVTWTRNTEDDILGISGTNSICNKQCENGVWSSEEINVTGLNTVTHLDIGYINGEQIIAYVLDEDSDLNSTADREIYLLRNGNTDRFTDNDVIDSNPVFEKINGTDALFWYSDFNIFYVKDIDDPVLNSVSPEGIYQLSDDYHIVSSSDSSAVLWTTVENGGSEVHSALYDGAQWSHDVMLTQTGQSARYPNGIIKDNGDLMIGFNRIANIPYGDYYKDGQADLCILSVLPSYNLSVKDALMYGELTENSSIPVSFTVENSGEQPVIGAYADIYDTNGTKNNHIDLPDEIFPGESIEYEINYLTSNTVKPGNIKVKIGALDISETDMSDNSCTLTVGQSDMSLNDVTYHKIDESQMNITVMTKNIGYTDAQGVKILINDNNGNEISQKDVGMIPVGEEKEISFFVNMNDLTFEDDMAVLNVLVSSTSEDANPGNNDLGFAIDKNRINTNSEPGVENETGLRIEGLANYYIYEGKSVKPPIIVYDSSNKLIEGKDYTLKYVNNANAYSLSENDKGFNSKKAPSITITGKGNYNSKDVIYFRILPQDISGEDFDSDDIALSYNKKNQKVSASLYWNGKALKSGKDYKLAIYKADDIGRTNSLGTSVKDTGDYVIRFTGINNFTGTREVNLKVSTDFIPVGKLSVGKIKDVKYTGNEIMPELIIKDGNKCLEKDKHYTLSYRSNKEVGTGFVFITGKPENGYSGTRRVAFKITGTPVKNAVISGLPKATSYTGNEMKYETDALKLYIKASRTTPQIDLVRDKDYSVSYLNNVNAGKATITIKGEGGYTGTVKKSLKIHPFDISSNMDKEGRFVINCATTAVYSKGGAKPEISASFKKADGSVQELVAGKDYTVSYKNNTSVGGEKKPMAIVSGKGNFKGKRNCEFAIITKDISSVTLNAADTVFKNKANTYSTKVSLVDTDGKALKAGTDYEKKLKYTYLNDTEVQVNGAAETRLAGTEVGTKDIIPAGTTIKVTATAKGNYTNTVSGTYRITKASLASASVGNIAAQVYTGKPITLDPAKFTVKVGKTKLVLYNEVTGEGDFIIKGYSNNTKKGTATITLQGVGNYGDTKTVKFKINAKGFKWWWRK